MNKIDVILQEALEKLKNIGTEQEAELIKVEYLGKKGKITELLKTLSSLSVEEKKTTGAKINEAKNILNENLEKKKSEIKNKLLEEKFKNEKIDISPAFHLHFQKVIII